MRLQGEGRDVWPKVLTVSESESQILLTKSPLVLDKVRCLTLLGYDVQAGPAHRYSNPKCGVMTALKRRL